MRFLRWLTLALVLLGALGVAGLVALENLDLNAHRALVVRQVKALTGRELRVDGGIELHVSLRPVIRVSGLHLSNAPWAGAPELLSIEHAEAELRLLPLLIGEPPGKRLRLEGVELHLETGGDGRRNWDFEAADAAPPAMPLLNDVRIRRALVTFRDHRGGGAHRVVLGSLSLAAHGFTSPVKLEGEGRYLGMPFQVQAELGSLAGIVGSRPTHVALKGQAAGVSLEVAGRVADPAAAAGLDLAVRLRGEDLAALAPVAGDGLPPVGAFEAQFKLSDRQRGLSLRDLRARLGRTAFGGELTLSTEGETPAWRGALRAEHLDLDQLLGIEAAPDSRAQRRMFSEEPLALEGLAGLDAELEIEAGRMRFHGRQLEDVRGRLRLAGGGLALDALAFGWAGGRVEGALELNRAGPVPRLSLQLAGEGLDMARVLAEVVDDRPLEGTADVVLRVAGRGSSPAAIAGSLDGEARLLMGAGRARAAALETLVGGASKVLGTLFSERAEDAVLNCAAAAFDVRKGVAEARVLLMDTEYSTVRGTGRIDLGSERLDLVVKPAPKSVTLNVAVPVEVGGTLSEPTFTPEKLATVRKIGGLLGILVYPPAALAGLAELGIGGDNPCLEIAAEPRAGAPPGSGG